MPKVTIKRETIFEYKFEGGGKAVLETIGQVDTAAAIKAIQTLINLKNDELGKSARPVALKATG